MSLNAVLSLALAIVLIPLTLLCTAPERKERLKRALSPESPLTAHESCRLYGTVETLNGDRPWGTILDAGTGAHSLSWLASLRRLSLCAVTGEEEKATVLRRRAKSLLGENDTIVSGNWGNASFLEGETFDTVIADYLFGAMEGFAPFFASELAGRLHQVLKPNGRLYVVGLEPYPLELPDNASPGAQLLLEVARVRDACILLAGRHKYREYPARWVTAQLERAGFRVVERVDVPSSYGRGFVYGQINVARRMLQLARERLRRVVRGPLDGAAEVWTMPRRFSALGGGSEAAVKGMEGLLDTLAYRARTLTSFDFGTDYVLVAEPSGKMTHTLLTDALPLTRQGLNGLDH